MKDFPICINGVRVAWFTAPDRNTVRLMIEYDQQRPEGDPLKLPMTGVTIGRPIRIQK